MSGWKSKLAIVAVTIVVASWTGYRAERRSMDAAGKPATTFRSVVRQVMAPKSRKDSFARLHELRHAAGRSQPTPREMRQSWEIIRGFTAEDVQAFLAEIPDGLKRPVNHELVNMLFFRWAQMDPEAAMAAASQPPYEKMHQGHYAVAAAWIDRDMDGAMRWAKSNGSAEAAELIAYGVGHLLAKQDPATALTRAKAEFPEAMDGVLAGMTEQMGGSKESRRKLFEILAGLGDAGMQRRWLDRLAWVFEENNEQALAAADELEESGLLPEQVEDFRRKVLNRTMYGRPKEKLELAMNPEANVDAGTQLNAYASWVWYEPAEAMEWAVQHGKIDFVAELVKRQSYEQIRSGWQPGDKSRLGWERGLRNQISTWQKHQPDAAEVWLQSLPADIRQQLTPAHDDGTQE